ncbi:hypothetical protein A2791_02160 [Candidatus Saccharibacteria bacterium RIFCSPHIGHO2_01_FULL_46_30]|nr:MAG: hypothetical protein A2791_02160 [Candidatus Saccharibacteria bacterium RIFCSPHIGHO2_01_FULL_46_30]
MIDQDRLHQTKFSHTLTEDGVNQAKRLFGVPKKKIPKQTQREIYVHQVMDSFTELQRTVESLDMAELFLKSYSVSKSWRGRYDQNHYFGYHYEAWIINSIRLYERLLILINSVYWLEIKHKDVSYKEIADHPKLRGTDTLKVLNKVHGAISNLQGAKNSVFHRYAYSDPELDEINKYNFLARNSEGEQKEQFSRFAKLKMRLFYLPQKRREVANNNIELLKAVDAILETLERPYVKHRDTLEDNSQVGK